MIARQKSQNLIVLTTTRAPYIFHIPPILSCPNKITYRFRYQNIWLHEDILKDTIDHLRSCNGLLYFRDNSSELKLCYPIRRFKLLWKDDAGVISFFNFQMADIIKYEHKTHYGSDIAELIDKESDKSLQYIYKEYLRLKNEGIPVPFPETIAAPVENEPPILTDEELHQSIDMNKYVWLDDRDDFQWSGKISKDEKNENANWLKLVSALSMVNPIRNMCFWRVVRLRESTSEKTIFTPHRISKSDNFGLHTWGYNIDIDKSCSMQISQIIPKTFTGKSFDQKPFDFNIESSDPDIDRLISKETIDGTYDTFELSFRFCGKETEKTCLLRTACTQPLQLSEGIVAETDKDSEVYYIPPTILPIHVNIPKRYPAFKWLAIILTFLIPFVSTIIDHIAKAYELQPSISLKIGIPAILLLLALISASFGRLFTRS